MMDSEATEPLMLSEGDGKLSLVLVLLLRGVLVLLLLLQHTALLISLVAPLALLALPQVSLFVLQWGTKALRALVLLSIAGSRSCSRCLMCNTHAAACSQTHKQQGEVTVRR